MKFLDNKDDFEKKVSILCVSSFIGGILFIWLNSSESIS